MFFKFMIVLSLTKGVWGNGEDENLSPNIVSNMETFTKQVLKKLFTEKPSPNLMKVYHLVFNILLWASREYGATLASSDPTIKLEMTQFPDTYDLEKRGVNSLYDENTDPTRTQFKQAEVLKDDLIIRKLSKLGIQL